MLSFSSFGSTQHPLCDKVRRAVELVRYADPTLVVDGEVQSDVAVNAKKLEEAFPFSTLKGGANVLIFPDLQSCNIAARLLAQLGGGETIGPILSGMAKPVHLLQRGAEVEDVVNIATIAVVDAQDTADSRYPTCGRSNSSLGTDRGMHPLNHSSVLAVAAPGVRLAAGGAIIQLMALDS